MKLFNKPKWLKPEVDELNYWFHLLIIVAIVYTFVNLWIEPMEITYQNLLAGVAFVGIGDIIAHTILRLD